MERHKLFDGRGWPTKVAIYDNGGTSYDRFTVVFYGPYVKPDVNGQRYYEILGMSSNPFHPQGFCQHDQSNRRIDQPSYKHLGKKITFGDLPDDCQRAVMNDYRETWGLRQDVDDDFPEKWSWHRHESIKITNIGDDICEAIKEDLKTVDRNLVPGLRQALRIIHKLYAVEGGPDD